MQQLTKFRFVGQISKNSDENRLIWIPKRFHDDIEKLEVKQVREQDFIPLEK
jgi:hypothetical protein